MAGKKQSSSGSPPTSDPVRSDLARVDTHEIAEIEYEDLPEWTGQMFEEADLYEGGKLVRRGSRKVVNVSIPLSTDVVAKLEATGPGWERRVDAALREWLADHAG